MPIVISHGPSGLGDDLMDIRKAQREQQHLDLLTKRVEQEMAQQSAEEGRRKALFGEHEQDRQRAETGRAASADAFEWLGGLGNSSPDSQALGSGGGSYGPARAGGQMPGGGGYGPSESPKTMRAQAQESDTKVKLAARSKILSALAKVDPEAAQRFYATSEKEMLQHGHDLTRGNVLEDVSSGLSGGAFDVPLASGQVDTAGSEMAKSILQRAQDPNSDPLKLAEEAGALRSNLSARKLHETRIRSRLEKGTAEMQVRSQLESPELLDKRQHMLQSLAEGDMDPKEFDKLWPDAGAGEQMRQLQMEAAHWKTEALKAKAGAEQGLSYQRSPEGMQKAEELRTQREIKVNAAKPKGAVGKTDPALSEGRHVRNFKEATQAAVAELGVSAEPSAVRARAAEILREAKAPPAQSSSAGRPTSFSDIRMPNGQAASGWQEAVQAFGGPPPVGANEAAPSQQGPEDTLRSEIKAGKWTTPEQVRARAKALGAKLK